MTISILKALLSRSCDHLAYAGHWALLDLLSSGGHKVSLGVKMELLANPTKMPRAVVQNRAEVGVFDSVMGTLVAKVVSHVMATPAVYSGGQDDEFWEDFFEQGFINEHGQRQGFHQYLTTAFSKALIQGVGLGQVDLPVEAGANEPYVLTRDRWELWNQNKQDNKITYAKFHCYHEQQPRWDELPDRYHEFLIYQREENDTITASKYRIRLASDDGSQSFEVDDLCNLNESQLITEEIFSGLDVFHLTNNTYAWPITALIVPNILWLADQLYPLQRGHFNHDAAGRWACLSTNYAMPILTGDDQSGQGWSNSNPFNSSPVGDGNYITLSAGQKLEWFTRPVDGIELSFAERESDHRKMLEKIHAIAQSLNIGVAQSGESKKVDRQDMDKMLGIYGNLVRDFAMETLHIAAIARGQQIDWEIEGFSDYDSTTLLDDIEIYLAQEKAGIPSNSLQVQTQKAIAIKAIRALGADQDELDQVLMEIDANATANHLDEHELKAIEVAYMRDAISDADYIAIMKNAGILPREIKLNAIEPEPEPEPEDRESEGGTIDGGSTEGDGDGESD